VPLLHITGKLEGRAQFLLELFHFDSVHILHGARDLQRAICFFSIFKEERDLLGEWAEWEGGGEVRLPW